MEHPDTPETEKDLPREHQVLLDWWKKLEDNRGDRAALRRAASIEQVMFNPAFHRLWRGLKGTSWKRAERVALIAALAARVREHRSERTFAAQLGTSPRGREKAALSGLRFRRLLQIREPDELLQGCSRAIAMCGNSVNLLNLAKSVYWWSDRDRKDWAFDYYDANPSAD
ncbi:MAG: type I-E CRISPR-associated protein Cse2/CasB [Xanthomonadales bacterium]|nr:type I-E CRISPR-associated protein Cse2/CasB [Xanthomonadales bacterium]